MNQVQAKLNLPAIRAFIAGEPIERLVNSGNWVEVPHNAIPDFNSYVYRVAIPVEMPERERLAKLLPFIESFAEHGKGFFINELYNVLSFDGLHQQYRKWEPKYRPYTAVEAAALLERMIVRTGSGCEYKITGIAVKNLWVAPNDVFSFESLLDNFTIDGKPCGTLNC